MEKQERLKIILGVIEDMPIWEWDRIDHHIRCQLSAKAAKLRLDSSDVQKILKSIQNEVDDYDSVTI